MPFGQVDTVRNKVSLCLLFLTTVTVDLRAVIMDTTVINYMIGKNAILLMLICCSGFFMDAQDCFHTNQTCQFKFEVFHY